MTDKNQGRLGGSVCWVSDSWFQLRSWPCGSLDLAPAQAPHQAPCWAPCCRRGDCLGFSLPLSAPPPLTLSHVHALSLKISKLEKRKDRQNQMLMRMWSNRNSHTLLAECKMVLPFWRMVWQFLIMLNAFLNCDTAFSLPGIYFLEMKTYVHKMACKYIFSHIRKNLLCI